MGHVELVAGAPEVLEWYWAIAIDLLLFILISGIGYIFYRNAKNKNKSRIDKVGILILTFAALIFFVCSTVKGTMISIDYAMDNVAIEKEVITDINWIRSMFILSTEGDCKYDLSELAFKRTLSGNEIFEILESDIVGHTCEIEYYKLSKRIIRITVIN